jgi:hypothetical protein
MRYTLLFNHIKKQKFYNQAAPQYRRQRVVGYSRLIAGTFCLLYNIPLSLQELASEFLAHSLGRL